MKSKLFRLCTLALLFLTLGVARAQGPGGDHANGPGMPAPLVSISEPVTSSVRPGVGLSQWIIGTEPDCCGPLDDHNPLQSELYFRSGVSIPFGKGQLADSLDPGWAITGGTRALCFNQEGTAAWTVDLGLENIHNRRSDNPPTVQLLNVPASISQIRFTIPSVEEQVSSLNRTFVNLGVGRECYLYGSARGTRDSDGARWRVGIDGGGRYGSEKVDFAVTRHFTDVIGGVYAALHTDLDIPCGGCCTFFAGFRAEWAYTWSDILQIQNNSDVQDFNLLASFGVRF